MKNRSENGGKYDELRGMKKVRAVGGEQKVLSRTAGHVGQFRVDHAKHYILEKLPARVTSSKLFEISRLSLPYRTFAFRHLNTASCQHPTFPAT